MAYKHRTMTHGDARIYLRRAGVDLRKDFHQLRNSEVEIVLALSKMYGYRKSRTAPGSTARMFFQFLQRVK